MVWIDDFVVYHPKTEQKATMSLVNKLLGDILLW